MNELLAWALVFCLPMENVCFAASSYARFEQCNAVRLDIIATYMHAPNVDCRHRDVLQRMPDGFRFYKLVR